jgi:hypothetical protein
MVGQQHLDGAHLGRGDQGPVMPRMSELTARFPLALMLSSARSLLAGQSVRRRWFGGVRGIPFAQRQLTFQIRDLLLGIGDLLLGIGDRLLGIGDLLLAFDQLLAELINLSLLPLDLLL